MSNLFSGTSKNAESAISAAKTAVASINSDIVTGSLDALNKKGSGKKSMSSMQAAMSDTYDLTKSVVGAVYQGKGTILEKINT